MFYIWLGMLGGRAKVIIGHAPGYTTDQDNQADSRLLRDAEIAYL
jgi:hypothetical protein